MDSTVEQTEISIEKKICPKHGRAYFHHAFYGQDGKWMCPLCYRVWNKKTKLDNEKKIT